MSLSQKNLQKVIIEYCFNKLFSVLKVGPFISYNLSFDLIIYNSTV